MGDLNLRKNDDDARPENFEVVERIRHPGYKAPSVYNDIAILKLNKDVTFSDYIKPACLNTKPPVADSYIATGWGKLDFAGEGSDHLQKVYLSAVPFERCSKAYPPVARRYPKGLVKDMHICAGGPQKDTCQVIRFLLLNKID